MTQPERPPLTRTAVVDAALRVIDRGGLNSCTMRAVAAELGVEAMSLYWHVENKDDLLDGVLEMVLAPVVEDGPAASDWGTTISAYARRFRTAMVIHPNVTPLMAQRPGTAYARAKEGAVVAIRQLRQAGFDLEEAVDSMRVVMRFVFGFTMVEAAQANNDDGMEMPGSPEMNALLASVNQDPTDRLFELGLTTLVRGIDTGRRPAQT